MANIFFEIVPGVDISKTDEASNAAMEKYFNCFGKHFPIHNYVPMAINNKGFYTRDGDEKIAAFIYECIDKNKPVETSDDYQSIEY